MWGLLIAVLIGVAVGYFSAGKQDKSRLFWIGALWAVVVAAILNVTGWFVNINPTTAGGDVSFFGLLISFLVTIAVFLIGVWVGDLFEGRRTRALPPNSPRV
jgi:hypothetical protein